MNCSYISGIKNTLVEPTSRVEQLNFVLRVAVIAGAILALLTYLKGDYANLQTVGIATGSVVGASLLLSIHTCCKEAEKTKKAVTGFTRFVKETAKTLLAPVYVPAALFEVPFFSTFHYQGHATEYHYPADPVERANVFLRLFALAGAATCFGLLFTDHTALLDPIGYSTLGVAGLSVLGNCYTTRQEWRTTHDFYKASSVWFKEMGKTVFSPLFIPRTLLLGVFKGEKEPVNGCSFLTGIENTMARKESKAEWTNFVLRLGIVVGAALAGWTLLHGNMAPLKEIAIATGSIAGASLLFNIHAAYTEAKKADKTQKDGWMRFLKEMGKTVAAPLYVPLTIFSAPFQATLNNPESVVEWSNVFLRTLFVAGGAVLLWAFLTHNTTYLYPSLYATGGVFALSTACNIYTGYQAGSVQTGFKEAAKTVFAPLWVPSVLLWGIFNDVQEE